MESDFSCDDMYGNIFMFTLGNPRGNRIITSLELYV